MFPLLVENLHYISLTSVFLHWEKRWLVKSLSSSFFSWPQKPFLLTCQGLHHPPVVWLGAILHLLLHKPVYKKKVLKTRNIMRANVLGFADRWNKRMENFLFPLSTLCWFPLNIAPCHPISLPSYSYVSLFVAVTGFK